VVHASDGRVAIQYWFFYYYNDWYNKHEGDWEMIQVELDAAGQPARAVYAQHHGGTARPWSAVDTIGGTHPKAYPALGSHADYFAGDTLYPQGADIGSVRIDVYDRTGSTDPVTPTIQLISNEDPAWMKFAGGWGERAFGDFSGPTGPAQKGVQWTAPFTWGDQQPSDATVWYHRNARAEIDLLPYAAALTLSDPTNANVVVESKPPRQTIVVLDQPDASHNYELQLRANETISPTLIIEWPDAAAARVTRREYRLALPSGAIVTTRLCSRCDFVLDVDTQRDGTPDRRVSPTRSSSSKVDFDPPESVVFYLPSGQIVGGLLIALLAAGVPTGVYALGVWWLDRYDKEPIRLLAAAFLWGALPGALVAVAARFVVAGPLAPLITESVKAIAVWFIFTRYRREFDDVLDGIVYGAMVGIGFAMMSNLATYIFGFLFGGFDYLRGSVLLNGIAFGLNEAYYGAIVGVGFGVSRWATDWRRIGAPLIALAAAVGLHLLTDFFRGLAIGGRQWLVVVPMLATWIGIVAILAIAYLSNRKQRDTIRAYLQDEVDRRTITPNEYSYLSAPARRSRLLLNARGGPSAVVRAILLQELAVRLAFRRRELALVGHDPDADATVVDLRQRIAGLRLPPQARDNR
jgi:RsiW-degrading membrane proteinase PrsW (M82 family)